jgi:PAS domain S-box-containing protein
MKDTHGFRKGKRCMQPAEKLHAPGGCAVSEWHAAGQTEAYLQSILRAVPSGIGLVANRIIMEVNPRACDILGYRREELVGMNSRMLYLSDEDYEYVGAEKYRQIQEHGSGTVETRFRRRDGRIIDVLLSSSPIDPDDLSKGVTFTVLDITAGKQAEIRLRESEEKYRSLVEQSIQGMIIGRDNPPRVCFASKPLEDIIGYAPREITGFSTEQLLAIVHPDDRESYFRSFRERISGQLRQVRREFRMIHKNGDIRWVEIFGTTILFEGSPATQTVMVDITERKHAEEEVRKSGEKLKMLFDHIRDAVFVHSLGEDGKSGHFVMANRAACRMLGYSGAELLSMSPENLYAPVFPATGTSREMKLLSKPESRVFEAVLMHRNGTRIPVEVSTARIELSGTWSMVSTVRDITGRKRSSYEELKKITTALYQSPAIVLMTNAGAEIEYVNSRFTELTGYASEEVLGKNLKLLQSGLMSPEIYQDLWETVGKGEVWKGELLNRKKNGQLYWEHAIISPVKNEQGMITNFVAVKEDITEKKRLWSELVAAKEKAEESDRLKTAFLANISHEIRTPMNGILGFCELLKDPLLSGGKQEEYIELIHQSGRRLLGILNDLIDISKIETGNIAFQYAPASLNEIFHDLQMYFEPQVKMKGLFLHCSECLGPSDCLIETDRVRLVQIFSNLLQNALKYTFSGGIEFGCTRKNDHLECYVRDTGIGIPDHLKERIFERFLQGQHDMDGEQDGVGLGLSISKSLVELLGGTIRLESTPGKGCVFYFTLPYRQASPGKEKPVRRNGRPKRVARHLNVLVAEDDNINRLLLERVLGGKEMTVISTVDGSEAVREVRDNPDIDVVLMDIRMPVMNGYEALEAIKRIRPHLPVIAHTAFALPEDRQQALDAGFDAFLAKPVNIGELFSLLQQFA